MLSKQISFFAVVFFLSATSCAELLPISQNYNLNLDEKIWQKGQGKLSVDGPTWNLFSNIKKSSSQIFFEDTYVPIKFAKDRLPKTCLSLLAKKTNSEEFCKLSKAIDGKSQELTLISVYSTQQKEILKFRTTVFIGSPAENEILLKKISKKDVNRK